MVLISKERIAEACKAIFPKWESLQQHERGQLSLNVAVALQAYEASRPSPSADLTARCAEILGWRRTGLLKGDSCRG